MSNEGTAERKIYQMKEESEGILNQYRELEKEFANYKKSIENKLLKIKNNENSKIKEIHAT